MRIGLRTMGNMGIITRTDLKAFALDVFRKEHLADWRIEWTTDGSCCLKEQKIILVRVHTTRFRLYPGYPWQAKEIVLHEIAHIFTSDDVHGADFYREYINLLQKYMVAVQKKGVGVMSIN